MRLERQVEITHPVGSSGYRRRSARVTAQVTLWRVLLAASVIAVAAPFVIAWMEPMCGGIPKQTEARYLVEVYAFEAFPKWATTSHERTCPASIDELALHAHREPIDPWGTPLEMRCPHARSFYMRSAGPDRTFDTTDDISSHEGR